MLKLRFFISLLLLAITAFPLQASDVEVSGGQDVVSVELYGGTWPAQAGTYYNPTGIRVGNELFLYAQTGAAKSHLGGPDCWPVINTQTRVVYRDQIILFRAPWTITGLTSQFNPHTFNPGPGQQPTLADVANSQITPCEPNIAWGAGGVFRRSGGGYAMTVDRANVVWDSPPGAPPQTHDDFKEIWIGFSQDGKVWSWEPLLKSTGALQIFDMTLTAELPSPVIAEFLGTPGTPIFSDGFETGDASHWSVVDQIERWWGFFRFNFGAEIGMIRVEFDGRPGANPRFRRWVWSAGMWQQVDAATGELDFIPTTVWPGAGFLQVNSIVNDGGELQVWAGQEASTDLIPNACGCAYGSRRTGFLSRPVVFADFEDLSPFSLGATEIIYSQVRCLPSLNQVGRMFPFRINDSFGRKLLYSVENKRCLDLQNPMSPIAQNPYAGLSVVVTVLEEVQLFE